LVDGKSDNCADQRSLAAMRAVSVLLEAFTDEMVLVLWTRIPVVCSAQTVCIGFQALPNNNNKFPDFFLDFRKISFNIKFLENLAPYVSFIITYESKSQHHSMECESVVQTFSSTQQYATVSQLFTGCSKNKPQCFLS